MSLVRRHSSAAIFMHWFNAVCWLILLSTGFGLMANHTQQPIGMWWVNFMEGIVGGGSALLNVHVTVAVVWAGVMAVMSLLRWKADSWPFLKEITDLSPKSDGIWAFRKALWLIFGPKTMRKMGVNSELPAQGFYNAGQKYVAILAVLACIVLIGSGAVLLFTREAGANQPMAQWLIFLHFFCAGGMAILLPVHIYMAALAPGEAPALKSMFTGTVPAEHVKHHNPLWYEELQREGKIQS